MEGDELREFGQILLNDGRVVFEEEVVEILGDEGGKRGEGNSLVVEVQSEEGSAKRVWKRQRRGEEGREKVGIEDKQPFKSNDNLFWLLLKLGGG